MNKGHLKMSNGKCQVLKMARDHYFNFNKIIEGPGTSFQSLALSQKKKLEMIVIQHTSI